MTLLEWWGLMLKVRLLHAAAPIRLQADSRVAIFNPDNPLGREMMARQVARQFCRLGEVHSLVYGRRASGENGRKLTASTRVGSKSRLMDYLGLIQLNYGLRTRIFLILIRFFVISGFNCALIQIPSTAPS